MRQEQISWVFVCQSGKLEREACVLAASLRRHLDERAKLIAAVPQPEQLVGKLDPSVVDFLTSLDVKLQTFTNPMLTDGNQTLRLLMNKAYTLTLDEDSDVNVFMDSDQICLAPVDPRDFVIPFLARRAMFIGTVGMHGKWQMAYDLCGAAIPQQQVIHFSERIPGAFVVTPPSFNSDFIAVHQNWAHVLQGEYVECFKRLEEHDLLGAARYFTEQIAFGIAVSKILIPYGIDEHRIDRCFFHYYTKQRLAKFKNRAAMVRQLCHQYPQLCKILDLGEEWEPVLGE